MIKSVDLNIWGRDFSLPVQYDCYAGEEVTQNQIASLNEFISNLNLLVDAKKKVEIYCKEQVEADDKNEKKNNIFSYIKPDYLFVKRSDKSEIALICNYRYDPEHGIAIVFKENKKILVGGQDIV